MSQESEYCRWRAAECGRRAGAVLPENRPTFLDLQHRWISFAEQIEAEERNEQPAAVSG
jgi:hypothetical protein